MQKTVNNKVYKLVLAGYDRCDGCAGEHDWELCIALQTAEGYCDPNKIYTEVKDAENN